MPQAINLAGVNSITVTWNAPAGYMYVVDPPPAGVVENEAALIFEAEYGSPGQASSLGSITASSFSINTVYGTAPLGAQVLTSSPEVGLSFGVSGTVSASSAPFAFTSMTISADFSGIGASTLSPTGDGPPAAGLFAEYTGDFEIDGVAPDGTVLYDVPPDPGQLLTLEPLPTGSVPDAPSTVILAGLSFAGFWLCGRKLSPDNH
ncbi:MAG TPA: hypothetical protein VK811_05110 [Candidatus Acidoferrum sp.]|nr:hypothetical protein [Candidatus Acidoferrum sp.]